MNIAIILTGFNSGWAERIAVLLSKKLSVRYNVYLFLLNTDNTIYEYGGKIVNIGSSGPFFEYAIKINKKKYKIDVAISFMRIMNFANIRTRTREKIIIFDVCAQSHIDSRGYAEKLQIQRYYNYADEMIVGSNSEKYEIGQVYGVTIPISVANNLIDKNILQQWIDAIERPYTKKDNPIESERERLESAEKIYIYGAGLVGKSFYIRLSSQYKIAGFIVSEKVDNINELYGVPVIEADCVNNIDKKDALIVGVGYRYQNEVVKKAKKCGFENIVFPQINPMSYDYYSNCRELDLRRELVDWSRLHLGRNFDIDHPVGFNEKIQWLKLYDSTELKTRLADKVLVRDYVKEKIGEEYLIPCLGVWDSFDEIDWDKLPDQFVLKCNHGSGTNAIIQSKKNLDYNKWKIKFDSWMKLDYSLYSGLEMHYKEIAHKILAEAMLKEKDGGDLKDYKVFVFNGKAKLIQVDIDRQHRHRRNIYDLQWNYIPVSILYPTDPDTVIEKPDCLQELITVAEELGKGFKHVRVDFYICNKKIYFGEMTFTHGSGTEKFTPASYEMQMGEWILL